MSDAQLSEIEKLLRNLTQHVLDMKLRQSELDMRLKRIEEAGDRHHLAMFEWCAPDELKAEIDLIPDPIDLPDDLAGPLAEFLKR